MEYGDKLDRFAQGLPDAQQAPAVAHCEYCGGEIYEWEEAIKSDDGAFFCRDECFYDYHGAKTVTVGEG